MDDLTKMFMLFGDDSKHIEVKFTDGNWVASYNDGCISKRVVGGTMKECCSQLYSEYCERYSPKSVAEALFDLLEEAERTGDLSVCSKRSNYIQKDGEKFIWKNVETEPKKAHPIAEHPMETKPSVSSVRAAEETAEREVHAMDGYPDYFMKETTDFMYTDCFGLDRNGGRIYVKVNRFDYNMTEIKPIEKPNLGNAKIVELGKDEFDSYYAEAESIIRNRKNYHPIDYSNVEIIRD